jgi:hypothetical protein
MVTASIIRSMEAVSTGVCCQFVYKGLAPESYIFCMLSTVMTHIYVIRQATACSVQCCELTRKSPPYLAFGSRDGQDISIYGCMCIDILILVYRLYHFIFSVPITKGSDN